MTASVANMKALKNALLRGRKTIKLINFGVLQQ